MDELAGFSAAQAENLVKTLPTRASARFRGGGGGGGPAPGGLVEDQLCSLGSGVAEPPGAMRRSMMLTLCGGNILGPRSTGPFPAQDEGVSQKPLSGMPYAK